MLIPKSEYTALRCGTHVWFMPFTRQRRSSLLGSGRSTFQSWSSRGAVGLDPVEWSLFRVIDAGVDGGSLGLVTDVSVLVRWLDARSGYRTRFVFRSSVGPLKSMLLSDGGGWNPGGSGVVELQLFRCSNHTSGS